MPQLQPTASEQAPLSNQGFPRVGRQQYVRAPQKLVFRSEEPWEEAVTETKRHLECRTTLYLLLKDLLTGDALGSDQFVYFDAADPRRCLAPDVFVKRGVRVATFDVWKTWQTGAPDLAVEIVSASDRRDDDWEGKLSRYLASGISEVVRFDPQDKTNPIRVWDRVDDDLVERAPGSSLLRECTTLGLFWAIAPSEYGPQLRLARDPEGLDLVPTPAEERLRLGMELAEERRARASAEHDRMLAEHARAQSEEARLVAEQKLVQEATLRQREAEARQREAEARQREAEARQREAEARQREAEARKSAERERDEALAELSRLRAEASAKR